MALHAESFGMRLFREPDAGNLPVRFDERGQETELCQTGLRRQRESLVKATGRLTPLRLFSTLLPISLIGTKKGEGKAQACVIACGC